MPTDVSKLCSDFLRNSCASETGAKLKAAHARELVAAFFGYKSHAALLAESDYPLTRLEETKILVPDMRLIKHRLTCLKNLPGCLFAASDLTPDNEIAHRIWECLTKHGYYNGRVWFYSGIEWYVSGVLLIEKDNLLRKDLADVMARTNAEFNRFPGYEEPEMIDTRNTVEIYVSGKLRGTQLEDKPFRGDTIDMKIKVTLYRIAGRWGFSGFDIKAEGVVNKDWANPELRDELAKERAIEQFLKGSGGFRDVVTQEQLEQKLAEIRTMHEGFSEKKGKLNEIGRLGRLNVREYH